MGLLDAYEEMMKERGIPIDHATINRWVIKYAPLLEDRFRKKHKRPTGMSWRMDETYGASSLWSHMM